MREGSSAFKIGQPRPHFARFKNSALGFDLGSLKSLRLLHSESIQAFQATLYIDFHYVLFISLAQPRALVFIDHQVHFATYVRQQFSTSIHLSHELVEEKRPEILTDNI